MSTPGTRLLLAGLAALAVASAACAAGDADLNPTPTAKDWAAIARLPDWSGVWTPYVSDQNARIKRDPTPWRPEVAAQTAAMEAEEQAGRPRGLFIDCLPEGMPSWMLITHNAFEVLFTPGRVTLLGEMDGNRIRRIYTDGRGHPPDPDPTFHGHSIGHWEGATLVVDTIGVLPEAWIAVSEAVGIPNNGDLHVIERIHLEGTDRLHDDLEIIAPHVLSAPWKTTRIYFRQRARKYDIVEGVCLQGGMAARQDAHGNWIYEAMPQDNGNPLPPK